MMEMSREKPNGLVMLFRDPGLRFISLLSLIVLVLLVSVEFLNDPGYIFLIGMITGFLFSYLFDFLVLYIVFFIIHPGIRKRGDDKRRNRVLWIVRLISIGLVLVQFFLFNVVFLSFILVLFVGSLIIWAGIESILFPRFAWRISEKIRFVGVRVVLYLIISIAYGFYLIYMLLKSPSSTPGWIDDTILDWIISLLLFIFALAKIGGALSPSSPKEKS